MTAIIRNKGQLTIPAEIRKAVHLEDGDPVEIEVVEGGILLRPQKVVDATQAWFWTAAWQERVGRSIEQARSGAGDRFESGDVFLDALKAE